MSRAVYMDGEEDAFDQDDERDLPDERPLPRAGRRPLPWFRMMLFSGLCIAVLASLAQQDGNVPIPAGSKPVPATILVAPPPTWAPVASGQPFYAIDKVFGVASAEARQHASGGREDTLTVGAPGDERYARVSFTHAIPPAPRSFYVDIVRRAAEAGLSVERNAQTAMVPTKFGPVESAAVTLAGPAQQNCQAFRFHDPDAGFGFQGWLCGQEISVDPRRLACFIDGMALAANRDAVLTSLFARPSPNQDCGADARTASIGGKPSKLPSGRTSSR